LEEERIAESRSSFRSFSSSIPILRRRGDGGMGLYPEKTMRTRAIRKEGLEPIIRVIARNLSEHNALLVEKTLL
jgi:hypothetical protein|tara:strand:- start:13917 stop:14138 length:222 start_codon:yes stop_codon:yes gene_type:complete